MFNDGGYLARIQSGDLAPKNRYDKHRTPPLSFLPNCSHSQRIAYLDQNGKKIVEVHQYLQPDGTLGASGLPDPKELLHNGIVYHAVDT